jgi:hypothetical protein
VVVDATIVRAAGTRRGAEGGRPSLVLQCATGMNRQTGLSVMVGEPPARVVDYGAVVAGSQTRCPSLVEVAWLGCAATAVSWADRRGLRGAWHRPN